MKKLFIVLALILTMIGCGKPNKDMVVGTYQGKFADAIEELKIYPDGKFEQKLTKGVEVIYSNSGTWELSGNDMEFHNFMVAVDLSNAQTIKDQSKLVLKPELFTTSQVGIENNGDFLNIAPDTLYYFKRVSKNIEDR